MVKAPGPFRGKAKSRCPSLYTFVNSGLETRQQRRFDGSLRTALGLHRKSWIVLKLSERIKGCLIPQWILLLAAFMPCYSSSFHGRSQEFNSCTTLRVPDVVVDIFSTFFSEDLKSVNHGIPDSRQQGCTSIRQLDYTC